MTEDDYQLQIEAQSAFERFWRKQQRRLLVESLTTEILLLLTLPPALAFTAWLLHSWFTACFTVFITALVIREISKDIRQLRKRP